MSCNVKKILTMLVLLCSGVFIKADASAGTIIPLQLPQSDAFSILGHSCGGIQEEAYATGFDIIGDVLGYVHIQTSCGGSGRGAGYHSTTYASWTDETWNLTGTVISYNKLAIAPTDYSPTFSAFGAKNDQIYNSNTRAYLSISSVPEPTEGALILSGIAFLGFIASRRKSV